MSERIEVRGMSCGHCVERVRSSLEAVDGVEVESVEIGSVRVDVDPDRSSRGRVEDAIRSAGYDPA